MTAPPTDATPPHRSPLPLILAGGAVLAVLIGLVVYLLLFRGGEPPTPGPAVAPPKDGATQDSNAPPWFRDVTAESGIDFRFRNGEEAGQYTILETIGGGVALIDYDGDGLLDVFLPGGGTFEGTTIKGRPCKLYKNLGGWKFRDVTAEAGLDKVDWWYTQGAAVSDYDRDGWPDLLVTGYGRVALFRNVPDGGGGRRFQDVTAEVGLKDELWSTSAGWADLDGDGYPDLYVCHYTDWSMTNNPHCPGQRSGIKRDTCPPFRFKPLRHSLFRNENGKAFRDVSSQHGLKADGYGLGVVLADLDGDARPDVYVANDTTNNYLYLNRGKTLEEVGVMAGVADDEGGRPNGSMGVDVGDFEGSGRPSIFVTNFQQEVHALYRNLGNKLFRHHSRAAGIAAIGRQWVGFGTSFIDVDNDGWEDLLIVNGHVYRHLAEDERFQRPILLHNLPAEPGRIFRVSSRGGPYFRVPALGRGLAVGDLDNDGWPDVVISHMNTPVTLLRNVARAGAEKSRRWLGVRLAGRGNRDVVGSAVVVELDGGRRLTRFTKGGGSFLSAGDPRLLFGLGEGGRVRRVTVRWSWGREQHFDGGKFKPNSYHELREGEEGPVVLKGPAR